MRKSTVFDGQRGLVTSIFVASLFVNILVLAVPLYMLQLFARVLSSGSVPTLIALSVGAMIALLFYFVFDAIRQRLISRLGTRLEADLGPTVLTVMIQSSSATDRRGTRPIADLHEIRRFVTGPSFTALLDAPWSLLFLAVIFMFSPVLGWISTAGILLLLGMGILSELTGRKPDEQAAEASKSANDIVGEMLRNADVVRSMGKTSALIGRWQGYSFASMIQNTLAVDRIALISALAKFVRFGLQVAILGVGVLLVLAGDISPGVMIATSILMSRAAAPVEHAIAGWRSLLGARAANRRLNELLGAIADGEAPIELPEPEGRVTVEGATVVFPNVQDPILLGVDFELRPGDSLGLVGPSGAGKTTLARCLVGLQPLSRGYIRIDDAALTDWPAEQIGRYIGYLPQRVELFDGTIAENIAMMDAAASPAAIIEAAKRADVHKLVLQIPGGYNAPVGLRGELLSAGQRQRIGLARAFYGNKKFIVLDEPNANLDADGEAALSQAVSNATSRGVAVVVVTHRLGILRQLSHAAMLQNGRIARFGKSRDVIDAVAKPLPAGQATDNGKVTVLSGTAQRATVN